MGGGRSLLGVPSGVIFSLSLVAFRSSVASLYKFLSDFGRDSNPARLVPDLVFFGFCGDGSRDLAILAVSLSALDRNVNLPRADLVGDRAPPRASSRDFLGERGATS